MITTVKKTPAKKKVREATVTIEKRKYLSLMEKALNIDAGNEEMLHEMFAEKLRRYSNRSMSDKKEMKKVLDDIVILHEYVTLVEENLAYFAAIAY